MPLQDDFEADIVGNFLSDFAVTVSYTPFGGSALNIQADFTEQVEVVDQVTGEVSVFDGSFIVSNFDVTAPQQGDGIVHLSIAYRVDSFQKDQNFPMTKLFVSKT